MPLWKGCVGLSMPKAETGAATEANFRLHPITATRGEWVGHIGAKFIRVQPVRID
jgi:hypothetical protein